MDRSKGMSGDRLVAMMFLVRSGKNSVRGSDDGNASSCGSSQPSSTAVRVVPSNLPTGFDSEPRPFMKRLSSTGTHYSYSNSTSMLPTFNLRWAVKNDII